MLRVKKTLMVKYSQTRKPVSATRPKKVEDKKKRIKCNTWETTQNFVAHKEDDANKY